MWSKTTSEALFLAALNEKIADYNKNPDHPVKLGFTEEIEKRSLAVRETERR